MEREKRGGKRNELRAGKGREREMERKEVMRVGEGGRDSGD